MKKPLLIIVVLHVFYFSNAQNVGIGNANPAYKLDLSGRMRIRGGINENFSAGLWLSGTGADSAVNKLFIGMRSDSSAGFYSGRLDIGWGLVFDGRIGTVGIGNPDPSFPLSFKDRSGDKISLYREGSNYYGLGIGNAVMQLITANNNSDIVFGYGRSADFAENMRIKGNGRLGIGTANPNATIEAKSNITGIPILRLSGVNEAYQDFYPLGSNGGRYGWLGFSASEPDKFFLFNDRNGDMSFITGGGERLTLKNNGNVGIGVSDPVYPLDISNRMRIRGKPGFSAGIWLNNEANSGIPAFIGMQADNQVGFYGSGTGWGLSMNTQNGSLSIAGNSGTAKQVLTSNGSSLAPTWETTKTTTIGYALATGSTPPATNGLFNVPGMTATITLTQTSIVILNYNVYVRNFGCLLCPSSGVGIWLTLRTSTDQLIKTDGFNDIPNDGHRTYVSGPVPLTLSPGTYTFLVQMIIPSLAANHSAGSASLGANIGNSLTWEVSPL
jgi:hypothetical protein